MMKKINKLLMHLVANARKNYAEEDDCLNDACFSKMENSADEDLQIAKYTIAHVLNNPGQAKDFATDIEVLDYFRNSFTNKNKKQIEIALDNLMFAAEFAKPGKQPKAVTTAHRK